MRSTGRSTLKKVSGTCQRPRLQVLIMAKYDVNSCRKQKNEERSKAGVAAGEGEEVDCAIFSTTLKAKRGRCAPCSRNAIILVKNSVNMKIVTHCTQSSRRRRPLIGAISVSATWQLAVQSHVIDSLHDAPSSSSRFVIPNSGPSCTSLLMRQAERYAKFLFQLLHQVCVTEVLSR